MDRRIFMKSAAAASTHALIASALPAQQTGGTLKSDTVVIRHDAALSNLPHVWEGCVGSDRAAVALRAQWLADMEKCRDEIGTKSVRFHGLFNDEMGVWPSGMKAPNFLYIDIIFDSLIARGIKPFVELSFMPGGLASGTRTAFFYRGNVTMPESPAKWAELVYLFAIHCIERYGLAEVRTWQFEVWNEANLSYFWAGTKADYLAFYRETALAVKKADAQLKVGGPSTARAEWTGDLLAYCAENKVPLDFISTHVYPDDPQDVVFNQKNHCPVEQVMPLALARVKQQIQSSATPGLPLYLSEWSSQNPAFITHTIKSCAGVADIMSFWTFDNVYEELGVQRGFMNTGYGMLGQRGIPRPSYNTFRLLHKLGDRQIDTGNAPVLATRRKDGSHAVLAWNLIPQPAGVRTASGDPTLQTSAQWQTQGDARTVRLQFPGSKPRARALLTRVDESHGNFRHAYEAMGSPAYPSLQQIEQLRKDASLAAPEAVRLDGVGELVITLPPNGIALVEV